MNKTSKVDWIDSLQKFVSSKTQRTPQEIDDETDMLFLKYIEEDKEKQAKEDPSLRKIPKFFQKALSNENQLNFKVRQEARTRFLHHKTSEILDKEGFFNFIIFFLFNFLLLFDRFRKIMASFKRKCFTP